MTTTATTRTEEFTGIAALRLENEYGNTTIRCTSSDGGARVRLTAHGDIDLEPATIRADGETLVVDIPGMIGDDSSGRGFSFKLGPISISSGATRTDVEIDLPHGATIEAKTKSGDITLSGESGDLTAKAGSGDITFEHAQQVHLTAGSGDISGLTCRGGHVTTGSGDISLDETTGADLHTRAGAGDISLRHTTVDAVTSVAGAGNISVHLGTGSLDAKSGTGTIDVVVPQAIPVWLDLKSGTGQVRKDIDPLGAPEEGQPHLRVMAKSGVGNIRVHH